MFMNSLSINLPQLIKSLSSQQISFWVKVMIKRILNARMVSRQRRSLAQLDNAQLKDIGITPYEAGIETSRDFWDIPENLK